MAGKNNNPVKKDHQRKKNTEPVKKTVTSTGESKTPKRSLLKYIIAILISICGMLIYSNTSKHDFVLDDFSVVSQNTITKKGSKAIGEIFKSGYRGGNFIAQDKLYRPLTKAMFAVEYEQSGGKPGLLHVMNILTYGLLCGFIFLFLLKLMPNQFYLALIATLLFTFHPIHTEVVANIKSRDEIMALWFILLCLWFGKTYADTSNTVWIIPSAVSYLLALFTKESAITTVALLPVTLFFFSKITKPRLGIITGVMVVVSAIYLYIHQSVVGSIGLNAIPMADNSIIESKDFMIQRMTAIEILGRYLKLLFIPHPLSCDYSFNTIPLVRSAGNAGFLLSLLIHLGGLIYAIIGLKNRSIASYAILFYLITISIVSNIFMLIGTNMAERLIFVPSLGFCLLIAYLLVKLLKADNIKPVNFGEIFTKKAVIWLILIPVLAIASIKTYNRNKDWRTISTLFNKDIQTVPNSIHMLYYHAGMLSNGDSLSLKTPEDRIKTLQLCEKELLTAVKLYDDFLDAHALLGKVYQRMGEYDKAIVHFKKFLTKNDKDPVVFNNYGTCYGFKGDYKNAEINFKKAIEISPICYADALCNLGAIYIMYGEQSIREQKREEAVKYYNMSLEMFDKTIACDAQNSNAYTYMGVSYGVLGDTAKSSMYTKKGAEMENLKKQQLTNKK